MSMHLTVYADMLVHVHAHTTHAQTDTHTHTQRLCVWWKTVSLQLKCLAFSSLLQSHVHTLNWELNVAKPPLSAAHQNHSRLGQGSTQKQREREGEQPVDILVPYRG